MSASSRLDQLKKLVEMDPTDPASRFMLAKEYLRANDYSNAATQLEEAIRIDPNYTAAYKLLGNSYEKAGEKEKAIQIYKTGIEVAEKTRDLQSGKEMQVFLRRLISQ